MSFSHKDLTCTTQPLLIKAPVNILPKTRVSQSSLLRVTSSSESVKQVLNVKNTTDTDSTVLKNKSPPNAYKTLLCDPTCLVIFISSGIAMFGITNFTVLLPSYAMFLEFSKERAAYLLSIASTFTMLGSFGGSTTSDWIKISKRYYFIGSVLFLGVSLVILPLHDSYIYLSVCCGMFGASAGVWTGTQAIVMVDILGQEKFPTAYGLVSFIQGMLQLIGQPLFGFAFQTLGTYKPLVATLGGILISGAAIWFYLPFIKTRKLDQKINH